jgi:hypothetical protein
MSCRRLLLLAVLASACQQEMADQPRLDPLEASSFFRDGRAARPLVPGTVARGTLPEDEELRTGKVGGVLALNFAFPVTKEVLHRGRERYEIFCTPCHDHTGSGQGMIVRRGFRRPESFHAERLRQAPPGHFVDVITNGFGAMKDYSAQVAPRDRWAIAAYIRALQLSQDARIGDVPPVERSKLEAR